MVRKKIKNILNLIIFINFYKTVMVTFINNLTEKNFALNFCSIQFLAIITLHTHTLPYGSNCEYLSCVYIVIYITFDKILSACFNLGLLLVPGFTAVSCMYRSLCIADVKKNFLVLKILFVLEKVF